jgi:non-ribosomal peptide synthetase component F
MVSLTTEQASVPYSRKLHGFGSFFEFRTISPLVDINAEAAYEISLGDARLVAVQPCSINVCTSDAKNKFHLSCSIDYDQRSNTHSYTLQSTRDLFNLMTVQDLANRFQILCRQLFCSTFDRQKQPVYELSILLPAERDLTQELNDYVATPNVTSCIHQAFAQQAMMHPWKVAVTLDEQSLTYGELLDQVQRLAFFLINSKGVRPGDTVCQCIDRSIEMIVGIMGIMMSGAVYAPLSTSDSLDRLQLLIHQVDAKLLLVNQRSSSYLNQFNVPVVDIAEILHSDDSLNDVQIEQLSGVVVTSDSISHIVFTSGSTGLPKAVQLRHRNFMAYLKTHVIQQNDIVLQLTSSSFDSHLDDIGGALIRGGHLVMLKIGGYLDFDYMTKVIYHKNVTYIGPVPSWISALGQFLCENRHAQERVKQVRWWYLGGKKK